MRPDRGKRASMTERLDLCVDIAMAVQSMQLRCKHPGYSR